MTAPRFTSRLRFAVSSPDWQRSSWCFAVPTPAGAAVTATFAGGTLDVTSYADHALAVTCDGADVKVNGGDPYARRRRAPTL